MRTVLLDGDCEDPEELIRRADLAMYRAKRGGEDRIFVYQASMGQVGAQARRLVSSESHG